MTPVARAFHCTWPADTGLFSPLQVHPVAVGRIAFSAGVGWLHAHVAGQRRLIAEHRTGLAVRRVGIAYDRPLRFEETDGLTVRATALVRHDGGQLRFDVGIADDSSPVPAIRVALVVIPLRIGDGPTLAAVPARLGAPVLALFRPDEFGTLPPTATVSGLAREVADQGRLAARSDMPFRLYRNGCEMADQWFWTEAISLAATAREQLVLDRAEQVPQVRDGLRHPVRGIDILFKRPCYLFDTGQVATTAWQRQEAAVFVHEIRAEDDPPESARAVVVERW